MSDTFHLQQDLTHGNMTDHYVDGHHVSTEMDNGLGGHDIHVGAHIEETTIPLGGGFTTVIHHDDPLMHLDAYHMDPLQL